MGGLHGFISWPRGMLTDSGGLSGMVLTLVEMRIGCMPSHCESREHFKLEQVLWMRRGQSMVSEP